MALLYPWATKEYLLWEMSLGQIVLYHNLGIEMKYGKPTGDKKTLRGRSYAEVKAARDEARKQLQIDDQARSDAKKAEYRDKYGEV